MAQQSIVLLYAYKRHTDYHDKGARAKLNNYINIVPRNFKILLLHNRNCILRLTTKIVSDGALLG